ncbi:hypothetical protein C8J56DRAFT_977181 [Mycena floridula]|nr:hypothetical protein C8J56DRAFT_977181 [Mycena floridula]
MKFSSTSVLIAALFLEQASSMPVLDARDPDGSYVALHQRSKWQQTFNKLGDATFSTGPASGNRPGLLDAAKAAYDESKKPAAPAPLPNIPRPGPSKPAPPPKTPSLLKPKPADLAEKKKKITGGK